MRDLHFSILVYTSFFILIQFCWWHIMITYTVILSLVILSVKCCPKQYNKFKLEQEIKQVDFGTKNPANIARHRVYKNFQALKMLDDETQFFILFSVVDAISLVIMIFCIRRFGRRAFRFLTDLRNETQVLRRLSITDDTKQ